MICKIVAEKRKDLHSFVVEEIPLDCIIDKGNFLSTRRYLSDGSLWQVTEISSIRKHDGIEEDLGCTEFYGRDSKFFPFKVGDIVELASKGFVELAIVFELPAMREEILPALKEYYQGSDEDRLGVFDDCYYIIDYSVAKDGKIDFVANPHLVVDVLPTRFPVPEEIAQQLRKCLEYYQKQKAEWYKGRGVHYE